MATESTTKKPTTTRKAPAKKKAPAKAAPAKKAPAPAKDTTSEQIAALQKEVAALREEVANFKTGGSDTARLAAIEEKLKGLGTALRKSVLRRADVDKTHTLRGFLDNLGL